MKERLEKLIDALMKKREGLVEMYMAKLDLYAGTEPGPQPQGMDAMNIAGLLHDLDKHITNLHLELRRIDALRGVPMENFDAQGVPRA